MDQNTYVHGSHNVICMMSGQKRKVEDCRYTWDGYLVAKEFWDPRHPQTLIRGVPDNQAVRATNPDVSPQFVGVNEVTPDSL